MMNKKAHIFSAIILTCWVLLLCILFLCGLSTFHFNVLGYLLYFPVLLSTFLTQPHAVTLQSIIIQNPMMIGINLLITYFIIFICVKAYYSNFSKHFTNATAKETVLQGTEEAAIKTEQAAIKIQTQIRKHLAIKYVERHFEHPRSMFHGWIDGSLTFIFLTAIYKLVDLVVDVEHDFLINLKYNFYGSPYEVVLGCQYANLQRPLSSDFIPRVLNPQDELNNDLSCLSPFNLVQEDEYGYFC